MQAGKNSNTEQRTVEAWNFQFILHPGFYFPSADFLRLGDSFKPTGGSFAPSAIAGQAYCIEMRGEGVTALWGAVKGHSIEGR